MKKGAIEYKKTKSKSKGKKKNEKSQI
jgi:hypothetical protein